MDLKILKTFKAVADKGSLKEASKVLMYSQSTISKHIKELEVELGSPIFVQGRFSKGLTEIGKVTYSYAVEVLASYDALKLQVNNIKNQKSIIRIAGLERYLMESVIRIVTKFKASYPEYEFEIISKTSDEALQSLKDYDIDIAIISDRYVPTHCESYIIKRENLVLIGSQTTKNKIATDPALYYKIPLLIDTKASTMFNYVLKDKQYFNSVIHVEGDDVVLSGVDQNICLGVVSDGCFAKYFNNEKYHVFKTFNAEAPIRMVYLKDLTEELTKKKFLDYFLRGLETEQKEEHMSQDSK